MAKHQTRSKRGNALQRALRRLRTGPSTALAPTASPEEIGNLPVVATVVEREFELTGTAIRQQLAKDFLSASLVDDRERHAIRLRVGLSRELRENAKHEKKYGEESFPASQLVAERCLICPLPLRGTLDGGLQMGEKIETLVRSLTKKYPKETPETWLHALTVHFRGGHYKTASAAAS